MGRWFWPVLLLVCLGASPMGDEILLGDHAWDRGDWPAALVHWSDALQLARSQQDPIAETDLLIRLAATYRRLGRFEQAGAALALASKQAPDDSWRARVEVGRGLLSLDLGDARDAEKRFLSSFKAFQRLEQPRMAAAAALDLGLARRAKGDLAGATKAMLGAKTLYETLGDTAGVADTLTNLGALSRQQGALAEARTYLEAAITSHRAAGAVDGEADAMLNLGLVLQDLGQDEQAEALFNTALRNARARKDVARQATALQSLGQLKERAGLPSEALAHFDTAEKAWRGLDRPEAARAVALDAALLAPNPTARLSKILQEAQAAKDPRTSAMALLQRAILGEQGAAAAATDAAEARELAERSREPTLIWRCDAVLGRIALSSNKPEEAVGHLKKAVTELERTRRGLTDGDADRFVSEVSAVYRDLVDALIAMGDPAGAFVYAQRLQAAETGPTAPADDPGTLRMLELAREEAALVDALAKTAQRESSSEQAAVLQTRLDEVRVAFADTVDELRTTHPDFQSMVQIAPEDLEALQRELPAGTLVLQPVPLADRLVLLVFTRDELVAHTIDVSGDEVAKTVGRLARLLQAGAIQDPSWTRALTDQLGTWLVAPIADKLAATDVLVVAATGPFRQLPFALLTHDGHALVEHTAVVGVTHVGSLAAHDASRPRFHVEGKDLLLVGNPDGTLPGAEAEVARIGAQFAGATTLIGPAATRGALLEAARGHSTLHLATHGMIDTQRPARSHLVLAGEQGHLGYREIPGLASALTDARMVVLSACESGRPVEARAAPENEGEIVVSINGLAAQFRRAGVETLVASLWRVDDDGTQRLMEHFYAELHAGKDVARALQSAQLTLARSDDMSHPWYWAGFQVVGDWR